MTAAEQRKKKAQQMAAYYAAKGDTSSAGAKAASRAVEKANGTTAYSGNTAAVQNYRSGKTSQIYANRATKQKTQEPNPALAQSIVNTVTAQSGGTSARTVQGVQGVQRDNPNLQLTRGKTPTSSSTIATGYSGGANAEGSGSDSVMKGYQESLKQAQAILQSYENGDGVYDEKDYALAKEEADRYQALVDQRRGQQEEAASGVEQVKRLSEDAKTGIKAIFHNPVMWASDTFGSAVDSAASGVASAGATLTDFGANVNEFTHTGDPEWQREQAAKMRNFATANAESAAQARQSAIETAGNTDFGAFATDLGVAGAQMYIDALTGSALGKGVSALRGAETTVGSMAPMLARSFGYGAQEAADKGFGTNAQVLGGLKSAGVEYLSEKLFGGNPVYDTDAGIINKVIDKAVGTENSALIRALSSKPADIVYEGLEEVVSDLLNPLIDQGALWLTKDERIEVDWPKAEELLRDFAIGSALSAASNLATGQSVGSEPAQQQTVNQTQNAPAQNAEADIAFVNAVREEVASRQAAQAAAQQAPQPTEAGITPQAENADSGAFNTAETAQEAAPTQTTADIYANRATKQEDGGVSVRSGPSALVGSKGLGNTLAKNIETLGDMAPVHSITGSELNNQSQSLSDQIRSFFKSLGNRVVRPNFGEVELSEYGVASTINHRPVNRARVLSVAAAPDVIENGKMIEHNENWKGRGYDSYVFAAPVTVGDSTVYVAAVVTQTDTNKFYLSEMVDSNGNYVRIERPRSTAQRAGVTVQDGVTAGPSGVSLDTSVSNDTITQEAEPVKADGRDMGEDSLFDATKGPGAGATRTGPQVPSQNNLTKDASLSQKGRKAVTESTPTHEQISDTLARTRAEAQIVRDADGSWVNLQDCIDDLRAAVGEQGALTPEQAKLAHNVATELDAQARKTGDFSALRAFNADVISKTKTNAAQSLHAWREFSGSSMDTVTTAMILLDSQRPDPNTEANKKRTVKEADRILQRVSREVDGAANEVFEQLSMDEVFSTPTDPALDVPNMRELIKQSWQNKQQVYENILQYYVSKYGMSEQEAALAANNIATQFYNALARQSEAALDKAFGRKAPRETKTWLDRTVELINMGALTDAAIQDAAAEKLFGHAMDDALLRDISQYAETAQELRDADDVAGLQELVIELSNRRGYKPSKSITKIIRNQANAAQLYEIAQTQTMALAFDRVKPSVAGKLSAWMYMSHLLNSRTIIRNVVANVEFSPVDRIANNAGIIPDFFFSMIRAASEGGNVKQNRTVGYQPNIFSPFEGGKQARQIKKEYVQQARLDNALDINRDVANNKYAQQNTKLTNRTYKRNGIGGGWANKTWNRLNNIREGVLGYGLNVTDAWQKGKTKGQSEVAMGRLMSQDGSIVSDEAAERITNDDMRYRSFQRDTSLGTLLAGARELANRAGVGEARGKLGNTHVFGLGNFLGNYTQVPGALVHTVLDYTPAGVINTTIELANAIKYAKAAAGAEVGGHNKYTGMKASDASVTAQHNAAVSIGRMMTGAGIMALFSALAKAGLVWYEPYGGDDKDKDETEDARGRGGLQINLDGLLRLATGEDVSLRGDDFVYGLGQSNPVSAIATAGVLMADEDDDDKFMRTLSATAESVGQMITDLSMMKSVQTISNDIKYAPENESGGKDVLEIAGNIGGDLAADAITGLVPGTIRQIAKALDGTVRDTSADTVPERIWNRFRSNMPLLRETLPAKLDYKGEEREYTGSGFVRALNTFVLPNDMEVYQADDVIDYIDQIGESTGRSLYASAYAPRSVTYGEEKYTLTEAERRTYNEAYKSAYYNALGELKNSEYADSLSDENASNIAATLRTIAADSAKRAYFEQQGIDYSSDYDKYQSIEDPVLYLAMKEAMKDLRESGGADNEAFNAVYNQWKGLSQNEKKLYTEGIDGEFSGIDTLKKLNTCLQSGMSTEQFYKAKNAHDDIGESETLSASEKRAKFANWLDTKSGLTTAQKRTALSTFPYTTTLIADEGNYEKLTAAGVSKDGGMRLFNAMQSLKPAEGYDDVANWQKCEAVTSSSLSDEEQLAALSVYATDSAYDYYQTAYDNGITPSKWSEVLANMRGYAGTLKSDGKTENTGSLSQENLLRAMQDAGLSDKKQRAMYAAYAANKNWASTYEDARKKINWSYYGY